ncbi:MAG: TIGR04255 family protein [Blastocatellia bacterium]|nr:TIGR04255 family protein [Blastocatellia bacterium]
MNADTKTNGDPGRVPERRYRKPPVIEALCEIYFAGSNWDETIPGAFYERVKSDFPQKRQRTIQEAQITLGLEHATAGVRQLPPWMQFLSNQKHRMIQLARDLLVLNQLAPYPHFEEWEPDVFRALSLYRELAQPERLSHLGLRYINRIEIPGGQIHMEDYFTIYPNLPPRLGKMHGAFVVRVEVPQPDDGHVVVITFGTGGPPSAPEPVQQFVLDFYDRVVINIAIEEEAIRKEIRRAHENIVVAFEDSITDKLRALFEPEERV